ncbi:MAG: DUF1848 domain-containing protein [Lachnospiraceae bacterium]|nr:DUF1848 domain-containing protein [Lachnospiraceae bacterium]
MIISASRRTDIPSFYSEWLINRLKEKYVLVRNPLNPHQVSKIDLSPNVVDAIVFWTKNPTPMLARLEEIKDYTYYFQFTLSAYGPDVEKNLPSKNKIIIPTFQKLSKQIGKEKVIWRYDPILFNEQYSMAYHCRYFELLASKLANYTEKCTVSFIDLYRNTDRNVRPLNIIQDTYEMQVELLQRFAEIAGEYGLYIDTCAEKGDFHEFGVEQAHCIDKERIERIGRFKICVDKDTNQRAECGCVTAIDIGAYDTCKNGCLYCYANHNMNRVDQNCRKHNPKAPLLFGEINDADVIKERKVVSLKENQLSLFDEM